MRYAPWLALARPIQWHWRCHAIASCAATVTWRAIAGELRGRRSSWKRRERTPDLGCDLAQEVRLAHSLPTEVAISSHLVFPFRNSAIESRFPTSRRSFILARFPIHADSL